MYIQQLQEVYPKCPFMLRRENVPAALFSNTNKINVLLLKLLVGTPFEWEENQSNSLPTYFQPLHLLHCGWSGKFAMF